jgi:predicted transglutaminase-like cysteine proteinase
MFTKKIYAFLSLPSFVLASACTTTQPMLDQSNIDRSDRVVHSKDINTKRGSVQTRSAAKSSIAQEMRSGAGTALSSGAGTQRGSRKPVSTAANSKRRGVVGSAMGLGAANAAPAGLYDFCTRLPQSCAMEPPRFVRAAETRRETPIRNDGFMLASYSSDQRSYSMPREIQPSHSSARRALPIMPISWTSKTRKVVNRINRQINAAMIGTTDAQAFGRQEFWTMPLSAPDRPRGRSKPLADCEDFALEKRKALIAAGIPEDALYLAVAVS